jgi:hypothetical protein
MARHTFWSSEEDGHHFFLGCLAIAYVSKQYEESFLPVLLFILKHTLAWREIMVKSFRLIGMINDCAGMINDCADLYVLQMSFIPFPL